MKTVKIEHLERNLEMVDDYTSFIENLEVNLKVQEMYLELTNKH